MMRQSRTIFKAISNVAQETLVMEARLQELRREGCVKQKEDLQQDLHKLLRWSRNTAVTPGKQITILFLFWYTTLFFLWYTILFLLWYNIVFLLW